jgi:hypothetical protein
MKWSLEASESASQAHLKPAQISMHFKTKCWILSVPTIGVLVGVMKTDLFHEIWALMKGTSDGRERGAEVKFKPEAMQGERDFERL